ncbi:Ribonucleotide reductase transcriptional regulator NrdR [hydrothermal vent metagenome]|uniref:Ribonucleotide reductase transcriptional regulator NrdR n=1 Tax=hydrothermal vent metagenome TaxID=652676 RepID=A0A3B1CDZ5_9ZZZZ
MKCPVCNDLDNKVIDSRLTSEGDMIRRRRECMRCQGRFTTYERIEESLPMIIKKDGGRQQFSREKIMYGIEKACHKRPVSAEAREELVEEAVRAAMASGEKEVSCSVVGEVVMKGLQRLDDVAYVRFASVYREFRDITQFISELNSLVKSGK